MILHRINYRDDDARHRYEWFSTAPKARARVVELRVTRTDAFVEKITVPETRKGLAAWLDKHVSKANGA